MNVQDLKMKPNVYFIAAVAACVLFLVFCIVSATIDGNWNLWEDSFSRMGVSPNPTAAFFFNGGCIISGILGLFAASGLLFYGNRRMKAGGMFTMLSMLFLVFVGAFTLNTPVLHYTFATLMLLCVYIEFLILLYDSIIKDRRKSAAIGLVCTIVPLLVCLAVMKFSIYQLTCITGFSIWLLTVIYGIRYEAARPGAEA